MNILLAEDNPINQEIALAIFQTAGVFVTLANNGREAVELVSKNDFDAVLMDIQMPEMDGFEATMKIRSDSRYSSLPIIAMTAHAMKGDEQKCINAGMDAYLSKPVNQERLFQVLSKEVRKIGGDVLSSGGAKEPQLLDKSMILLPGIDVEGALESLNLDIDSYVQILKQFREVNMDYTSRIWAAFNDSNSEKLKGLAHSIKGSSGSIGAKSLYETASALELASSEDEVPDRETVVAFERNLDLVLRSIKTLENGSDQARASGSDEINADSFAFSSLKSALKLAQPARIDEACKIFERYVGSDEAFKIKKNIRNYDFDEALENLDEIMKKYETRNPLPS